MSESYLSALYDWWCRDWLRSRVVAASLACAALAYFALQAWIGSGPNTAYGIDLFILLDGGWRVVHGQIPYRDFCLGLGPLEPLLNGISMKLAGGSPQMLAFTNLLVAALLVPWTFALTRSRMPAVPAVLTTVWLMITGLTATPLGTSSLDISYAVLYNRHGYALLAILAIECLLVPQSASFWSGLSSGVALMSLLFLKLNFFGVGAVFVLFSVVSHPRLTTRIWGIAAGCGATLLAFTAYLHFSLAPMISDMAMVLRARSTSVATGSLSADLLRPETPMLLAFTVACALLVMRPDSWMLDTWRYVGPAGLIIAAGLVLIRTNGEELHFPLHMCWTLILLGGITRISIEGGNHRARLPLLVIVGLGLLFSPFVRAGFSVANWLRYGLRPQLSHGGFHLNAPAAESLRFFNSGRGLDADENGQLLVGYVNDGLDLIRANSAPNDKVMTLGYVNPFSYCLRRPPAKGGGLWLSGSTLGDTHYPPGERMFGDADIVMTPQWSNNHLIDQAFLEKTYGAYLAEHFELKAKSQWWTLYRRR